MNDIKKLFRNPRIRGMWIYLATREANTKDLIEMSGYTEKWLHNGILKRMQKANIIEKDKDEGKFTLWKATTLGREYLKIKKYYVPELKFEERKRLGVIDDGYY
jgi:DNA-binding MarR family transcriptional regulator